MKLILTSLILILTVACASKKPIQDENAQLTTNDYIDLKVLWVQDKGDQYNFKMSVTNKSQKDLMIILNDVTCLRGGVPGAIKHSFFSKNEPTIKFKASESKVLSMVCAFGANVDGPFKLVFNRLWENPKADGATRGPSIDKRIEWEGRY